MNLIYLCQTLKNSWPICPRLCVSCEHAPSTLHLDCHLRVVSNNTENICKKQSKQVGVMWESLARPRGLEPFRFSGPLKIFWKYCLWSIPPFPPLPFPSHHHRQPRNKEKRKVLFPATGSTPEHGAWGSCHLQLSYSSAPSVALRRIFLLSAAAFSLSNLALWSPTLQPLDTGQLHFPCMTGKHSRARQESSSDRKQDISTVLQVICWKY